MDKKEFINKIKNWLNKEERLTIAIDGYSGTGKTTLLKELNKEFKDILAVYMDDFILPGDQRDKWIKKLKDKSEAYEFHWYYYDKIKELVNEFKKQSKDTFTVKRYRSNTDSYKTYNYDLTKKILIIEGIFLFHPKLFNNIFDKKVFLDIDLEEADKRRVVREKKRWGKDYFLEDHPDSYTRIFKIAYRRYLK